MSILLETERIILRRFTEDDLDLLFALDNDPEVMRYINKGIYTPKEEIKEKLLPRFLQYDPEFPVYGFWAVIEKATGYFLGWISLQPSDDKHHEAILGYRLHKSAWGKGIATEGASALIQRGFSEMPIKRVMATTYQDNLASQRVMQKLGMRFVRAFQFTEEDFKDIISSNTGPMDIWVGVDVEYALERVDWEQTGRIS